MNATFEDHPTDPDKVILRKKPRIDQGPDYERGFIDGMQYQMQSSVDKAINRMAQPEPPPECETEAEKTAFTFGWWKALEAQRTWVGLTDEEREELMDIYDVASTDYAQAIEAKLKEKNNG